MIVPPLGAAGGWVLFNAFVVAMLALDLGVFHRRPRAVSIRESLAWVAGWVGLAIAFNVGLWLRHPGGSRVALEFLTGYLIELALSVDNLFVFLMIFSYFRVPAELQHRVLFWGILSAIVLRGVFIVAGVALINRFDWLIYGFGAFLVVAGARMMRGKHEAVDLEHARIVRWCVRWLPMTRAYDGSRFVTRLDGRRVLTPLALVLVCIEATDVVFAMDSIPAIMAITRDPFIIFTSNVFAILGLRSLFFALAGLMRVFVYLHYGLAAVLIFVGIKMLVHAYVEVPIWAALGLIVLVLAASVAASLLWPPRGAETPEYP